MQASLWLVENTIGQTSDPAVVCAKERGRTKRLEIEPKGYDDVKSRLFLVTSERITIFVTMLNTKICLHVLDCVAFTFCSCQSTRNCVSIHYLGGIFVVCKRIETYVKMLLIVSHVKIDIPTVRGPQTFSIFNERAIFRFCDAHKIWLVQWSVTKGPSVDVFCKFYKCTSLQNININN